MMLTPITSQFRGVLTRVTAFACDLLPRLSRFTRRGLHPLLCPLAAHCTFADANIRFALWSSTSSCSFCPLLNAFPLSFHPTSCHASPHALSLLKKLHVITLRQCCLLAARENLTQFTRAFAARTRFVTLIQCIMQLCYRVAVSLN
jgi:hypothetical protein